MAKSILQEDKTHCFLCGKNNSFEPLECHHVFGAYNRNKSEKYGLTVYLHSHTCHKFGKNSVHQNAEIMQKLHEIGQRKAMEYYGWSIEDFIQIFGRSYL